MNIKKIIGSRITQARKANGLTIKVLAERTGLGVARIGNWEQGTRSPGPAETKLLSEVLNVAGAWLLCLTDDPRGENVCLIKPFDKLD
ncbi:helix-turn-helix domain-containing protein [Legionella cincinnatiensis]|uniref:Phage repressor n=1 Tax=Legionella cincinnatiensis TaxID=28085 RepID=A0A378IH89_9GAMM|nr:helix-turn-helix transcriptional regulator [Legionella cincinnatiensis]KTC93549.1 phage repressor [Legionella cincinnatiensis]STX34122.1 phage repressor [Legionella cincinnatiensis]